MKMTFVKIKYEKDDYSDTITISRHNENYDGKVFDYVLDSYDCIAALFDRVLNKYFISTDKECCHGGHKYNNTIGNKAVFQKTFKEMFNYDAL